MSQAIIAALSWPQQVIGYKGRLPWHIPLELRLFRAATWGGILVMGRRTYESLGRPNLPGRELWVLSQNLSYPLPAGVQRFPSWEVLGDALSQVHKPVFFAGGEQIFTLALQLPSVEYLLLSWVFTEVKGDVFFPTIPGSWQPESWEVFHKGPGVPVPFIFTRYHRVSVSQATS